LNIKCRALSDIFGGGVYALKNLPLHLQREMGRCVKMCIIISVCSNITGNDEAVDDGGKRTSFKVLPVATSIYSVATAIAVFVANENGVRYRNLQSASSQRYIVSIILHDAVIIFRCCRS